jgi:hypothetical protein
MVNRLARVPVGVVRKRRSISLFINCFPSPGQPLAFWQPSCILDGAGILVEQLNDVYIGTPSMSFRHDSPNWAVI